MSTLSKVCDAADWFNHEFLGIIKNELQEAPRFHRKQWEFAMIFMALQKYGYLQPDRIGLSMGGGKERVLYAIARHIRQLIVTDLYDRQTTWDCARTDDPDIFIKSDKPFEVDDAKLQALRMDMRELRFDDGTFDFCYSSCAIEHIGRYSDFLLHLNEVHRVLKEGGIYVLSTEFHFGSEVIEHPNNYIFSPAYLRDLIAACRLTPAEHPDVSVTWHNANVPLPSNVKNLCYTGDQHFSAAMLNEVPHLHLLRGKFPFTSILLILKKESNTKNDARLIYHGFDDACKFMQSALDGYRSRLRNSLLTINPFSALRQGVSPFFQDHAEFFSEETDLPADDTLFHSDYHWLGAGERTIRIGLSPAESGQEQNCVLQLRIHRYQTLTPAQVECVYETEFEMPENGVVSREFNLPVEENYCYAILGKMRRGNARFREIKLWCMPGKTKGLPVEAPANGQLSTQIL